MPTFYARQKEINDLFLNIRLVGLNINLARSCQAQQSHNEFEVGDAGANLALLLAQLNKPSAVAL